MSKKLNKPNITIMLLCFIAAMQLLIFAFMILLWSMTNDQIVDLSSTVTSTVTSAIKAFLGG